MYRLGEDLTTISVSVIDKGSNFVVVGARFDWKEEFNRLAWPGLIAITDPFCIVSQLGRVVSSDNHSRPLCIFEGR